MNSNSALSASLLVIASAPILEVETSTIEVTPAGRAVACEIDNRCSVCGDDLSFCDHEPSAEQVARWNARRPDPAVRAGINAAFRSLGLADRLAQSMKDDKRP